MTEPTERFDHGHIDIVGPLPYANGFRYLLTCVDRFTRWPDAIPIVENSGRNGRRCLLQRVDSTLWYSRHYHHR